MLDKLFRRFEGKFTRSGEDECWEWKAARKESGYGVMRWGDGKNILAHRASHIFYIGPIPEGLLVRHRCGNPGCVNPKHLLLSTQEVKNQDARDRDRFVRGEGSPGNTITPVVGGGVPLPVNFVAAVQTEVVSGGASAALIVGTWDYQALTLNYELEYEPTDGSAAAQSVFSNAGETTVRTGYLVDGKEYRVRLRTWGGGSKSDWTGYQILTAVADPTPPGMVTGAAAVGDVGQASFSWTAPNSANYAAVRIYMAEVDDFAEATVIATEYGAPNIADGRIVTGLTAGTKYAWLVAINASGIEAAPVATGSFDVT